MPVPRFAVTYTDGKKCHVRVSPKAQVIFERQYKITMSRSMSDASAEHLYYLAWAGLHCAGMEGRDFDAFLDAIADVVAPDDEEDSDDGDPTRSAPGPAPSSS